MNIYCRSVFIILALFIITACSEQETDKDMTTPEIVKAVKTQKIEYFENDDERVFSGTTISSDAQSLSFRVSGVIIELPVKVGDTLDKGSLIARLDSTDFDISSRQAQASVSQAKAAQVSAKSAYQRSKELYSAQAATLAELEAARANADSAKASLNVSQQQLNSVLKNKQYTQLKSSSDNCIVIDVPTSINRNISAGSPVVNLSCGEFMSTKITVPETIIKQISKGDLVTVTIPSRREQPYKGKVTEVGVSNQQAAGFDVEVALLDDIKGLRVGVTTSVKFNLANTSQKQHTILPAYAVINDASGSYVYVLSKNKTNNGVYSTHRKTITIGEITNAGLQILSGLNEGDQVIISGVTKVSENMKVKRITEG